MERLPDLTNVTQNELDLILDAANTVVGFPSASVQSQNTGASRLKPLMNFLVAPLIPPTDILSGTPWTRGNMPQVSNIDLARLYPTSFLENSDVDQFHLLFKK